MWYSRCGSTKHRKFIKKNKNKKLRLCCKQICNLHGGRNKRENESVNLKMLSDNMTINFNILDSFMKNYIMCNLNSTLIVTIQRSRKRKINTYTIEQPM